MPIEETIENIRKKPEHVRMWYVMGIVTIFMTLIVILWIFSIREGVRSVVRGVGESTPALQDARGEINSLRDAIRDTENQFNAVEAATQAEEVVPQPTPEQIRQEAQQIDTAPAAGEQGELQRPQGEDDLVTF